MSKPHRVGLVVGKFSPLHRGHELLIERALECCDEVILISYSKPELPGCEPERRERWLAELFPQCRRLVVSEGMPPNDADEAVHRRYCAHLCDSVLGARPDAVFTSEDYGDGFARELTAHFRRRDPSAPEVRHVLVDRERRERPISGTAIRADVHAHARWLSPIVRASFVKRACLLGGESTGKSTLAARLAEHLETVHVAEFGRELWEAKAGALEFEDMRLIAEEQVRREERALLHANGWLLCDTSPLTTLFYSRELFSRADPALEALAERRYDATFLCAPDFPFVQDGTRQPESFRLRQHEWYLRELDRRGVQWFPLSGSMDMRIARAREALGVSDRSTPSPPE